MNYKLAKKLKDAGFPQKGENYWRCKCKECTGGDEEKCKCSDNEYVYVPTLEELIDACGEKNIVLWGCKKDNYYASISSYDHIEGTEKMIEAQTYGKTPTEAVAKLYLKLNETNKNKMV